MPRMTPWLQAELHGLAQRLARNDGHVSEGISARVTELAAETGFQWSFLEGNIRLRCLEILRREVRA